MYISTILREKRCHAYNRHKHLAATYLVKNLFISLLQLLKNVLCISSYNFYTYITLSTLYFFFYEVNIYNYELMNTNVNNIITENIFYKLLKGMINIQCTQIYFFNNRVYIVGTNMFFRCYLLYQTHGE